MSNIFLHIHPKSVNRKTLSFYLTWGLGGMALVLILLLALTGILLMLVYEPAPDKAYESIKTLQENVFMGVLVRNIHYWSGNLLVIVSFLHLLRVFFTGGFHGPRRFNWLIGIILFAIVLISNFTGYLLPWDQLSYWAISISTGMLDYLPVIGGEIQSVIIGGRDLGADTLSLFFALHIIIMPLLLFLFSLYHFWLVRKAGGVVVPQSTEDNQETALNVPTVPNLTTKELSAGLALIAFVMVFSIVFDAPFEAKANPGLSPNPTKAPWFMTGIQEMLIHFHPFLAAWIIPGLITIALFILPYKRYDSKPEGIWFCSEKGRNLGIIAVITAIVLTLVLVALSSMVDGFATLLKNSYLNILISIMIIAAVISCFYLILRKRFKASNNEGTQAVFILLFTGYIMLSIICYYFRGKGMEFFKF